MVANANFIIPNKPKAALDSVEERLHGVSAVVTEKVAALVSAVPKPFHAGEDVTEAHAKTQERIDSALARMVPSHDVLTKSIANL